MARPFRHQPPAAPARPLVRERLVAALATRWDHRLVTIIAGPGFGKTALLVTAMAGNGPGDDVWLCCEPADESGAHLTAALATALNMPATYELDRVIDEVWARAPKRHCFMFDDVQNIGPESGGAEVLRRLVEDLPTTSHLVMASRAAVPVPTARLAAAGGLLRLTERDLLFDDDELSAFAAARGIEPRVLASAGGWPALAELAASAGADLVSDYLWEEVLARVGARRARLLALLATVGGADERVASAVGDDALDLDEVTAGVPLVQRWDGGWVSLHPLWLPALRRLLTQDEAKEARRRAAEAHLSASRPSTAIDLLIEAEAWDDVLAALSASIGAGVLDPHDLGRWYDALPAWRRNAPAAQLAHGLHVRLTAPLDALPSLTAAVDGFRSSGDVDGEVEAIREEGIIRWWTNDFGRLLVLHDRARELAAQGSQRARKLEAIGVAAMAHLAGDSETVLRELGPLRDEPGSLWLIGWLRSVAHRRNGDLDAADRELDRIEEALGAPDTQATIARLRGRWLRGDVDAVVAGLVEQRAGYSAGDVYLLSETSLELAARLAWLGDVDGARALRDPVPQDLRQLSALTRTLDLIATAAIHVAEGRDDAAAATLAGSVDASPGRPESWYWRDRAAVALPYVLLPDYRDGWEAEVTSDAHAVGLRLAAALAEARSGNLDLVHDLVWPYRGLLRAHLPRRWLLELAAAGRAAGNPPPPELIDSIGAPARDDLQRIAKQAIEPVAKAATKLRADIPRQPSFRLSIDAVGPLVVARDGEAIDHRDLARRRVRELLCHMVARKIVRREQLADELWPALADPAGNLRVTLTYVQRVLEPDRQDGDPPYFLRSRGEWLALVEDELLSVDVWRLDAGLLTAESAERERSPAVALAAYRRVLPLWRGEPYADVGDAPWLLAERSRLRDRYVSAAVRAGELLLASAALDDARDAARLAIAADPVHERGYALLTRIHLAGGDLPGAARVVEECRHSLAALGLAPVEVTTRMLAGS